MATSIPSAAKPEPASSPLEQPLTTLKGVGESKAKLWAKLGITTTGDLLTAYPRRYEDRSRFAQIAEVADGEAAALNVKVLAAENRLTASGKTLTKVTVEDDSATATMVFFNQHWLREKFLFQKNKVIPLYATVVRNGFDFTADLQNVDYDDTGGALLLGRIVPFYNLTEGLTQNTFRKLSRDAVPSLAAALEEVLPEDLRERHELMPAAVAAEQIHWPETMKLLERARRRLVFEELFLLQVALAVRRKHETLDLHGIAFDVPSDHVDRFEERLPYALTGAQRKTLVEILGDMRLDRPMNRLLQGDVGSGKTVVAAIAMAAAAGSGFQAAVMAPTEILAEQHFRSMSELLTPLGLSVELMTGSMTAKAKREARERVAFGFTNIVVGTHALIQEGVNFHKLGLVVVDEQHRFGVLQRAALKGKGDAPDVLVMTATPIPRTLTMVVYGDLDVSTIDEMPPGRKPVTTHLRTADQRESVYRGVEKLLAQGRQAFFVCPLVEESDKLQSQAATQMYEYLQRRVFPHRRVGVLHGQMPQTEKDTQMAAFRAHETDILVATTVIEVGVDVPNASCMVVEDAERFGLSQLHQLRGRVGRGADQSYCILISETEGIERLQVMASTTDGFVIANEDLRLRGPGEFFGTRQSGMPSLKIANIVEDLAILEEARTAAFGLLERDPELRAPENQPLRRAVERQYAESVLATVS